MDKPSMAVSYLSISTSVQIAMMLIAFLFLSWWPSGVVELKLRDIVKMARGTLCIGDTEFLLKRQT
jgi:hypothetical protein